MFQAHLRSSSNENHKCCSTELVAEHLSCCNSVGFDPTRQICGDTATHQLNDDKFPDECGKGQVCSLMESMFAACDR